MHSDLFDLLTRLTRGPVHATHLLPNGFGTRAHLAPPRRSGLLAQDTDGVDDAVAETADEVTSSARGMWETFVDALPRLGVAITMVVVGWMAARLLRALLRHRWCRTQTPSFAEVMSRVTGWAVVAVVTLFALAVTFPSVRPVDLLAGLGFFSVAIGFAFQDILENTLSGILLLFRQPFRSGDQIEVREHAGTVEAITIRETRITTFDGQLVIIPNRDVYKSAIVVQTAYPSRRAEFTIGIAYEADPIDACRRAEDAVRATAAATTPAPRAFVSELGASAVELTVWFWTPARRADLLALRHEAMVAVTRSFDAAGIEMPSEIVSLRATRSFAAALDGRSDRDTGSRR